jgi:hypothetical protein
MEVCFPIISLLFIRFNFILFIGLPGRDGLPGLPGPKGEAVRVEVRK